MPPVYKVNPFCPQRNIIKKAAAVICRGGLVAFPTETVYGIAALLENADKLDKIKNRPAGKPYTVHLAFKSWVRDYIKDIDPLAKDLIRKYWPGPLTIILRNSKGKKIGFRMPDNKIALALIRAVGRPLIAPSANRSGCSSPVKADQVCDGVDLVLDGGRTKYARDSMIIDLSGKRPEIVREGSLSEKIKVQISRRYRDR